jgi:hypothetical protein
MRSIAHQIRCMHDDHASPRKEAKSKEINTTAHRSSSPIPKFGVQIRVYQFSAPNHG